MYGFAFDFILISVVLFLASSTLQFSKWGLILIGIAFLLVGIHILIISIKITLEIYIDYIDDEEYRKD